MTYRQIYLDHAATTALDPEVADGLRARQATLFANPKSSHAAGRAAGAALTEARARIAQSLGGQPKALLFTGGGTEALNLAILGSAGTSPGRIAVSAVEHSAVMEAARWLEAHRGWQVDVIPVNAHGQVTPTALEATLKPDTRVVAMMLANNEVGAINPIAQLARVVRQRAQRARIVVDAVQAFGKIPVSVRGLDVDCVAVTAHKLHGPKGIGALWTRVSLDPPGKGGGQEGGVRGGTQSATLAWAFAEAAARHGADMPRVTALRDRLLDAVMARQPDAQLSGPPPGPERLGNNLHLMFPGVPGEPLLNALSARGVCVSAGSACSGGRFSRVLSAMGRTDREGAFLRLTPGRFTTEADIDQAADHLHAAVKELRSIYG